MTGRAQLRVRTTAWALGVILMLLGVWWTDMFLIGFGAGMTIITAAWWFMARTGSTEQSGDDSEEFWRKMVRAAQAMGPRPGLSLQFIRELVGHPPKYADALSAMHHVPHGKFYPATPPEPGSIAYYDSQHGNVAYALPGGQVIALDERGYPIVTGYDERDEHNRSRLGVYQGWSRYLGNQKV